MNSGPELAEGNLERTFLLEPQRFDRIQTRRFLGGIKTEEAADGDIGVCQWPAFIWEDPDLSGRLLGISH